MVSRGKVKEGVVNVENWRLDD